MAREEFEARLRRVTLDMCDDAVRRYNLSPVECRDLVEKRLASCLTSAPPPSVVADQTQHHEIIRPLLECITPYYFCNGVEIKDAAQAVANCPK